MVDCLECGAPTKEYILPSHHLDLGGVRVDLRNSVHVRVCSKCGEAATSIPDLPGLGKTVAMARALMPFRLQGADIRFMRRALDMSQAEFARAMDVAVETISRWENGERGHGEHADKSVRFRVCALLHRDVPGISYDSGDVARMQLQPGAELPELVIERVVIKSDGRRTDAWDAPALAA